MNTGLIDCLSMTLFSAIVCVCLPRVLTLLQATFTRWSLEDRTQVSSNPEFSQANAYPEFTP
ncbi:MAG: hypothetical protein Fur006_03650 [Coleofasciculaceae cyanobacterium]